MTEATRTTALLGPTNTGKTHRATERMLEHDSGMIGLPLRLLAREVYDRVTARIGESRVALVTGEEKRVPRRADYWVCTVEAMPVEREVDFVAVDEIQLAAHAQRGHVFTDRLMHARGRKETWFMGSDAIQPVIEQLAPAASVVRHPRLSKLTWARDVSLQKVPRRSAVVAFSMPQVYEIAERLRALRGGTAVVLGALSPRTRNAQVAMFQAGEVDYLVATDAIGMGLNLDVRHVAFASLRKFDGRDVRGLDPSELAQIAGRAGRYLQDGTFGTVSPVTLAPEVAAQIEGNWFPPVRKVFWRRHDLDFTSLDALAVSLRDPPRLACLRRVAQAEDEAAFDALAARDEIRARVTTPREVRLLWDVCTVPDFRKLLFEAHIDLLASIFEGLTSGNGRLSDAWMEARVRSVDDPRGDVDTLVGRIAAIRTWTYVAHQPDWVADAARWQDEARAIEDRLSDALHERLVQRFVDVYAPARDMPAKPRPRKHTLLRDEPVEVAPGHPFAKLRTMRDAMRVATEAPRVTRDRRVDELVEAPHERFTIDAEGRVTDGTVPLARLTPGTSVTLPGVELVGLDAVGAGGQARIQRRLVAFVRDAVEELLAPLRQPGDLSPVARGLLYRLEQGLGTGLTRDLADVLGGLTPLDREQLEARGVHLGARVVFARSLLKPEALASRLTLARVYFGLGKAFTAPPPGAVSVRVARGSSSHSWLALGYPVFGPRAVRADIAEKVYAALTSTEGEPLDQSAAATRLGASAREVAEVIAKLRDA